MPWDLEGAEYPWPDPQTHTMVYGHCGDFRVEVVPMIFNDRILITHRSEYPDFVIAGFCYAKGGAAGLAAAHWVENWEEMETPVGFKKIAVNDLPLYGKGARS